LDEQPKDFQPSFLREGGQGGDDIQCFHISANIEIYHKRQIICGSLRLFD
jgi:hypothetical protein